LAICTASLATPPLSSPVWCIFRGPRANQKRHPLRPNNHLGHENIFSVWILAKDERDSLIRLRSQDSHRPTRTHWPNSCLTPRATNLATVVTSGLPTLPQQPSSPVRRPWSTIPLNHIPLARARPGTHSPKFGRRRDPTHNRINTPNPKFGCWRDPTLTCTSTLTLSFVIDETTTSLAPLTLRFLPHLCYCHRGSQSLASSCHHLRRSSMVSQWVFIFLRGVPVVVESSSFAMSVMVGHPMCHMRGMQEEARGADSRTSHQRQHIGFGRKHNPHFHRWSSPLAQSLYHWETYPGLAYTLSTMDLPSIGNMVPLHHDPVASPNKKEKLCVASLLVSHVRVACSIPSTRVLAGSFASPVPSEFLSKAVLFFPSS
jgi:hypothetical protein